MAKDSNGEQQGTLAALCLLTERVFEIEHKGSAEWHLAVKNLLKASLNTVILVWAVLRQKITKIALRSHLG